MLADDYAVVRLPPEDFPPPWALTATGFVSITRTDGELSVVCREADAPDGVRAERGWRALMLHGPFDFAQTGVLASYAQPLARAGLSIFAVSTFDTDFILVKASQLRAALAALVGAGHVLAAPRPTT